MPPVPDSKPVEMNAASRGKLLHYWRRAADFSDALCYTLKEPIQGKSMRMVLASLGNALEEVNESVQQASYEWAKISCCKKSLTDLDRITRVCHHALTSTSSPKRVFLMCTSRTGTSSTTVVEIKSTEGKNCYEILNDSKQFKCNAEEAVVLAWFADERGMAVLPASVSA